MLISSLLGTLVGLVLGLTGAGGGILAVPALVFGMGWTMQQAAPVALIAVAGGAAVGAVDGLRKRLVRWRAALLMAGAAFPCTFAGVRAAHHLPQQWLLGIFAAAMLLVAARLLRGARHTADRYPETSMTLAPIDRKTGRIRWSWPTALLIGAIGAATGFMTGLLGVGGGFIVVPLLRRYSGVSMHGIIATSLLVIAVVSSGGVAIALLHGAVIPLPASAWFAGATAAGMLIGRLLARRLSAQHVQFGFALVLSIVALGLLARSLGPG